MCGSRYALLILCSMVCFANLMDYFANTIQQNLDMQNIGCADFRNIRCLNKAWYQVACMTWKDEDAFLAGQHFPATKWAVLVDARQGQFAKNWDRPFHEYWRFSDGGIGRRRFFPYHPAVSAFQII